nr:MAG TPA: hypothetical protein [Bacteriophage sp.]
MIYLMQSQGNCHFWQTVFQLMYQKIKVIYAKR